MGQSIQEQSYLEAYNKLQSASTVEDYQEIIGLLNNCSGFLDSDDLTLQCRQMIDSLHSEELYSTAVNLSKKRDAASLTKAIAMLESLGEYKDSQQIVFRIRQKMGRSAASDVGLNACPQCGYTNNSGSSFCTKCGATLNPASPAPGKTSKRLWIIIGAISILILGIVIGIIVHSSNKKDPSNNPVGTHTALSSDDINGTSYEDIINQYRRAIEFDFVPQTYIDRLSEDYFNYCYIAMGPVHVRARGSAEITISYALRDINQDGIDELILRMDDEGIIDIFTMGPEGAVSLLGQYFDSDGGNESHYPVEGYTYNNTLGDRDSVWILSSGDLIYVTSWPGSIQTYSYSLPAHGTEVVINRGISMSGSNYYEIQPGGTEISITQQVYDELFNEMEDLISSDSNKMSMEFTTIS